MPRPRDYGLIYNWDGTPHGYSQVPQSMEAFLDKVYAPLEDTQVGAHFWCVGDHNATWKSDALEMVGDVAGRTYDNAWSYAKSENVREMLERGEDPQEAVIIRGRELGLDVFCSVRMNDNHLNGLQPEDLARLDLLGWVREGMGASNLTQMRIEHPEWLLGKETVPWFACSWNFEVPEVREHKYAIIEEVCGRYDWDGLEMDWLRHYSHLPEDDGYRMRYVLTDLQRRVRRMTNELGEKRGRPFYLAARVSGTLESSYRIGFDIPTWIKEGLVDILIPAGGHGTDPSIDVATYLDLCRGTDVVVYPGLDIYLPSISGGMMVAQEQFVGPEGAELKEKMWYRGLTSRYHNAGADGIYLFNWYANRDSRRDILNQIGSQETMRGQDKIYAATHRVIIKDRPWAGSGRHDTLWGEVPVRLKPTFTGDGPTITLDVPDDLTIDIPKHIELRVRLDQWVKGDVVRLYWDGVEREDVETRFSIDEIVCGNPHEYPVNDVGTAAWLASDLSPADAAEGKHEVKVVLEKRNPKLSCDIVLTNVELVINYGEKTGLGRTHYGGRMPRGAY